MAQKGKNGKKMVKKSSNFNIMHPQGWLRETKLRAFIELFEALKTPTPYCFSEKSIKNLVSMKFKKRPKNGKKMVKKSSNLNIMHALGGLRGTKLRAFIELFEGLKTPTSYCFLEKSIQNLVSMKIKKRVEK